ncbi:MAG: ABC transporter ATP-binding protein [Saprospiraceae bacterium]
MHIHLTDAGKRFRLDWIFRGINTVFQPGESYAILGPNGSGKSTLLKVLSGHLSLSKGRIEFKDEKGAVPIDQVYKRVAYAAPYIELIEEFTLEEAIRFHGKLKPFLPGLKPVDIYQLLELPKARHKEIRFFSSGMKQRLKLALAVCSDVPLLLLDEPTTNLDLQAIDWYKKLIAEYAGDRLLVIASNDPSDLELCTQQLHIQEYKK